MKYIYICIYTAYTLYKFEATENLSSIALEHLNSHYFLPNIYEQEPAGIVFLLKALMREKTSLPLVTDVNFNYTVINPSCKTKKKCWKPFALVVFKN